MKTYFTTSKLDENAKNLQSLFKSCPALTNGDLIICDFSKKLDLQVLFFPVFCFGDLTAFGQAYRKIFRSHSNLALRPHLK